MNIKEAVKVITDALYEDKDYFRSWQSNIAMAFIDELHRQGYKLPREHDIANVAAAYFISNLCRADKPFRSASSSMGKE